MESNGNRNHTLDVIKLIAAFFVVFIHVPFYGVVGEVVTLLARFAVPVFFMTSGFFCYENDNKTILRKIKKLGQILIFTALLYNLTNLLAAYLAGGIGAVGDYFLRFVDVTGWIKLLFFNLPFSATRLWFLYALIYVYFMQMLFNKCNVSDKAILVVSISAIMLHFLFGSMLPYFGRTTDDYICRNFLLMGYPFFGFGLLFRRYRNNHSDAMHGVLFVVGCVLSLVPMFYESLAQISIGTLVMVFTLFSYALKKATATYPGWVLDLCDCSLGIYIFHRPVTVVLEKIVSEINLSENVIVSGIAIPLLVCLFSALVSLLFVKLTTLKKKTV